MAAGAARARTQGRQAQKAQTKKEKPVRYFDYSLLFLLIFLMGFGLIMLYSTSSY